MTVLLFDIDGTLLHAGGAGQFAMESALQEAFGVCEPAHDIPAAGRTDRAIVEDLFAFFGIADEPASWDRFMPAYFRWLPVALERQRGEVLPGVAPLLEELANRTQLTLGLLTGNFATGAQIKLSHFGLDHYFPNGGAFGDQHRSRNDVARDAWTAVQRWRDQVSSDDVWIIGDTPADIQCARAINARVMAVATGMFSREELTAHQPDELCDNLSDREWFLSVVSK